MRFLFGRFIDCFILWLLGLFHSGTPTDQFWLCLSANAIDTDFFIHNMVAVFNDRLHAEIWKLYAKKAWHDFEDDVLDRQLEVSEE